jgi:hypothetical protein
MELPKDYNTALNMIKEVFGLDEIQYNLNGISKNAYEIKDIPVFYFDFEYKGKIFNVDIYINFWYHSYSIDNVMKVNLYAKINYECNINVKNHKYDNIIEKPLNWFESTGNDIYEILTQERDYYNEDNIEKIKELVIKDFTIKIKRKIEFDTKPKSNKNVSKRRSNLMSYVKSTDELLRLFLDNMYKFDSYELCLDYIRSI